MFKALLLILFISASLANQGSLQVNPVTSTLFSTTNYELYYYSVFPLPQNATFILDFTNTYIHVPDASMNVTATIQGSAVTGVTATCASMKCTIKPNNAMGASSNLKVLFGLLTNPYFVYTQTVSAQVQFNNSYTESLSWNISSTRYTPQAISVNKMTQSNYGVGNNNVTYTFNLSLPMTPQNPQLSFTVPSEVGYANFNTSLSFYNR